jgi:protein-glucosylgalactosylhydroxylysine glucosidase
MTLPIRALSAWRRRRVAVLLAVGGLTSIPGAGAQAPTDVWALDSGSIDPAHYYGETVANGRIGILSTSDPFRTAQTLLNGAFEPLAPGNVDCILRTLSFLNLHVAIDDVPIGGFAQISGLQQTLDMKRAVLTSTFDIPGKAHVTTALRALRTLPYVAMQEITLTAQGDFILAVSSDIEQPSLGQSAQGEDPPYPELLDLMSSESHVDVNGALPIGAASAYGPTHRVLLASAHSFLFDGAAKSPGIRVAGGTIAFARDVHRGETLHFAILGATITSAQTADPLNEAQRLTATAWIQGLAPLIAQHEKAWAALWQSDIRIEGDDVTQRDVHSMIYHLYAMIRESSRLSISPMGLSRDVSGYLGHIFWDAETWMFPALLALHPELARGMLDYRIDRLEAARQNALASGYEGAMYPWESAASGREDTPLCCLPLEIHITGDVALAVWNYYRVTQDKEWLRSQGYPLLRDTADFWVSRVSRGADGAYHLTHVVAADEYATDVDDNAFTNAAARSNLQAALAAAHALGVAPHPLWQSVHDGIPILKFPDGTTREYASYDGMKVKQADVNLLAYPLSEVTGRAAIERDLNYYSSRTDENGPAMTKSVLAILHERLGNPARAYEFFKYGYESNERPPFGALSETAKNSNPYFVTAAGGLLQTMLYGFGGLDITDSGFQQRPTQLPAPWHSLTLIGVGVHHTEYRVR